MTTPFKPGKTAVITGAAMGIGRAASIACAKAGMKLVLLDAQADKLAELQSSLTQAQDVHLLPVDLNDQTRRSEALQQASTLLGAPDFLMNNAASRAGHAADAPLDDWRQAFEVNFWAIVEACKMMVPLMQANGGAIVNVGSKQGITNPPGHPVYNATKAAIKSYTETLEHDLRNLPNPTLTSHLLIPGWTTSGTATHREGAWHPEQVVERMFQGVDNGDFYILCPDNETTPEQDHKRILWGAGDIIENRPPLSRWHKDWSEKASKACT